MHHNVIPNSTKIFLENYLHYFVKNRNVSECFSLSIILVEQIMIFIVIHQPVILNTLRNQAVVMKRQFKTLINDVFYRYNR